MTIESNAYRMKQRRAVDAARRLRAAADRTAGQLGTLTTQPKTPHRDREFKRLSKLLDSLIERATYWENRVKDLP